MPQQHDRCDGQQVDGFDLTNKLRQDIKFQHRGNIAHICAEQHHVQQAHQHQHKQAFRKQPLSLPVRQPVDDISPDEKIPCPYRRGKGNVMQR